MSQTLILTRYHFMSLWNWRSVYLGRLIEPVAYFAFLAVGIAGISARSGDDGYFGFVIVGMVCLLAFRAATSTLSDVANDRKWGVFAIFVMQGGGALGYLVSIVLVAVAVFLAQFAVLVVLATAITSSSDAAPSVGDLLWIVGSGLLVVVGWVGVGAAVGTRVKSYARRDFIVTVTSLPVVLAAPLFYPLDAAPAYLRAIAAINPLTYQAGWIREVGADRVVAALGAGAWCVAALVLAVVLLRSSDRLSTER